MTQREAFIARLESRLSGGVRNLAIENHLAKIRRMDDAQFAAHKARLDADTARAAPMLMALAEEIVREERCRA